MECPSCLNSCLNTLGKGKFWNCLELKKRAQLAIRNGNFESCARKLSKISSKIFHSNTYFFLISRICLQCFVQGCLRRKFCNVYWKKTCLRRNLFSHKFSSHQPDTFIKKKKSSTAVFLRLLRKLYEQLFYGTIPGDGLPLTVHFDEVFSFPQGALKSNVISTWILRLCFFRDSILMLQHVF